MQTHNNEDNKKNTLEYQYSMIPDSYVAAWKKMKLDELEIRLDSLQEACSRASIESQEIFKEIIRHLTIYISYHIEYGDDSRDIFV